MDNDEQRPPPPEFAPGTGDWREHLPEESRHMIVDNIVEVFKRHLPLSGQEGLEELRKFAVRFEDKMFQVAIDQRDYLRKTSVEMLKTGPESEDSVSFKPAVDNSSNPPDPVPLESTARASQANGDDWQEETYQKIKSLKELYGPELNEIHQKIVTELQQPNSEMHEKFKSFKALLERLITFLEVPKSEIHSAVKEKLPWHERQIMKVVNRRARMQQRQLPTQHMSSMQPQQPQPQSNEVDMNSPQQVSVGSMQNPVSAQLNVLQSNINNLQASVYVLAQNLKQQQEHQIKQQFMQQCQQHQMQLMQIQQLMQQQLQLFPPDSIAHARRPNGSDWQEETYQKIQSLKVLYLPELNEMYRKIATKLQQYANSEPPEKLKIFKSMLERLIAFVQVPKSEIHAGVKEKLPSYEKQILRFLNVNRPTQ